MTLPLWHSPVELVQFFDSVSSEVEVIAEYFCFLHESQL